MRVEKRVLIATASRHGATHDIADEIGRVLARRGIRVTDKAVAEVDTVAQFDAVLVGSAVYIGHWLPDAVSFVARFGAELAQRPTWLFSSGPIGRPAMPQTEPEDMPRLMEQSGARSHRIFAGLLDADRLGLGEKMIVRVLRAPRGDFRDWPAVDAWADEVADQLLAGGRREGLLESARQ